MNDFVKLRGAERRRENGEIGRGWDREEGKIEGKRKGKGVMSWVRRRKRGIGKRIQDKELRKRETRGQRNLKMS